MSDARKHLVDAIERLKGLHAIYSRVHEEMDGGDYGEMKPYEQIDNGLINGGEKMSYEAWRGYMTQSIILTSDSIPYLWEQYEAALSTPNK